MSGVGPTNHSPPNADKFSAYKAAFVIGSFGRAGLSDVYNGFHIYNDVSDRQK